MSRQRVLDTEPEVQLRAALRAMGCLYRKNVRPIPSLKRTADVAFLGPRVAVFVDGCFWHGCVEHKTLPKSNPEFWLRKIERNRERDRDTNTRLEAAGWTVIRLWEHDDLQEEAVEIAERVRLLRAGLAAKKSTRNTNV